MKKFKYVVEVEIEVDEENYPDTWTPLDCLEAEKENAVDVVLASVEDGSANIEVTYAD